MNNKKFYEITYIIKPGLTDTEHKEVIERFDNILKENGGQIIKSADWQTRKLAYEIDGQTEGVYHIVNLSLDSDNKALSEFDRLTKINPNILRSMVVIREEAAAPVKKEVKKEEPKGSE